MSALASCEVSIELDPEGISIWNLGAEAIPILPADPVEAESAACMLEHAARYLRERFPPR